MGEEELNGLSESILKEIDRLKDEEQRAIAAIIKNEGINIEEVIGDYDNIF